jgi:hypothetical protein
MGRRPKDYVPKEKEIAEVLETEVVATTAISEKEYQRRIKLDVSNPLYINPSYDR